MCNLYSSVNYVKLLCCREYAKKYHQLVSKCSGNGDSSCILCGVRFKGRGIPQKSVNCHDCTKVSNAACYSQFASGLVSNN